MRSAVEVDASEGPPVRLPAALAGALTRLAGLEVISDTPRRRRQVIHASGRLLRSAADAGWPVAVLAAPLGVTEGAARHRVRRDRIIRPDAPPGLVLPPPPRRGRSGEAAVPKAWLRAAEAASLAGINRHTLYNWRRAGLLPSTRPGRRRYSYARADLLRLLAHRVPYHGHDVHYVRTRAALGLTGPIPPPAFTRPGPAAVVARPGTPNAGSRVHN